MSDPREHITCIAHSHVNLLGKSWCGRDVRAEFTFVGADHALYNSRNCGRLIACSDCVAEICGTWREEE